MKNVFTLFLSLFVFSVFSAQNYWQKTTMKDQKIRSTETVTSYYSLDLGLLRNKLSMTTERSSTAKSVEIILPLNNGRFERFAVYSFPVMDRELANKYQLGSFEGVGIDDPSKFLRFSISPTNFSSMIIKNGEFEFIDPQNKSNSVYGVHAKTYADGEKGFLCNMNESVLSKEQINNLFKTGKKITKSSTFRLTSSDKKYRTMRLALSVTGEYTAYFGGTIAGALTAMNNTMTRVNGVLEKDLALHLNMINNTSIIFTDATTDPYSDATDGADGAWNKELMDTLHSIVGDSNFDIGHLFGASGGGGNAGCIGCVCSNDISLDTNGDPIAYKGSGFTSPADGIPMGDNFDIDYVVHEMGHQLGANHTFSFDIEGTGVNMEPGSGSTIMGYAGITGATDLQSHSDPYFHVASIEQIQLNLQSTTCDVETAITNNPPIIASLPSYTIPKGTAFVLSAQATDPESNPLTYVWEEYDDTSVPVIDVTGNNTTGAIFRSWSPSTSPVRYFPKLSSVLAGNLTIPSDWETVSNVARTTNFKVTVRDNHPTITEQQTQSALQTIVVGNDGPFNVTTTKVYNNISSPISWNVANTNSSPYNATNVMIDYSTDNGVSWNVLSSSTPNDGSESFDFSSLSNNQQIIVRVSSINNVFYAVNKITVGIAATCSSTAPTGLATSGITSSQAIISWDMVIGATYVLNYKKSSDATWTVINLSSTSYTLTGLSEDTSYDYRVATVCSGVPGNFSAANIFVTLSSLSYCAVTSQNANEEYISNVTVNSKSNTSADTVYSDFSTDDSKIINLVIGSTANTISVTKAWLADQYSEGVGVWIDFNRNGTFETTEKIFSKAASKTATVSGTFTVPSSTSAYEGKSAKMRVIMQYNTNPSDACSDIDYGEIEDYKVRFVTTLGTDTVNKEDKLNIYPNPATDFLNVTKVSSKAKYAIYSLDGKLVSNGNLTDNKVAVSKLEKGVYVITIEDNGKTAQSKFIKK